CLTRPGKRVRINTGVTAIEIPSFEPDKLRKALAGLSPEIVFHLASYGVQAPDRDGEQLIEGNIRLTAHLLQAVAGSPLRTFLFAGSCSEYGPPEAHGRLMAEDHPLRPTSVYGAAKAAAELYGNALAGQLKVPFTTLRLFNVYGPGEGPYRLIPFIMDHLLRYQPAELTGGEQVRDFLHCDEVASALIAAASADLHPHHAYNVCSGQPATVREAGELAADALGKPRALLQWGKRPYRNDEPMWVVGDNTKFHEATGWQPHMDLRTGIRRMIEIVRQQRSREHQHAV